MSHIHWPATPAPPAAALMARLYQLAETEWWSPERLREHQFLQLTDLLNWAREHVLAYRERLADLRCDGSAITPDEFTKVPLLTRAEVQELGTSLHSVTVPADHGRRLEYATSGATGRPLRGYGTEFTHFCWSALNVRDHLWHRRDLSATFAAIRTKVERATLASWGAALEMIGATGQAVTLPIHTAIGEQLKWLCTCEPSYLLTHASNLRALVRESHRCRKRPRGLLEVMSFGEALPEDLRSLCREVWNVRLVDLYSSEEAGYLALECPDQPELYHVQDEHVLLEVLDEAGCPCPPGAIGRIAITPLHNYAMPLVRYVPGDYAQKGGPCACGRGLSVLKRINGRSRNLVRLPDGSSHWPSFPAEDWLAIAPVRQFQLRQRSRETIDVRLTAERLVSGRECDALRNMLQTRLRYPFDIRIRQVSEIPTPLNGKLEDFICEVSEFGV